MSTPVLRALAGKPGAAKRALLEQYGDTGLQASHDGQYSYSLCDQKNKSKVYAVRCHGGSLCTQKQPKIIAMSCSWPIVSCSVCPNTLVCSCLSCAEAVELLPASSSKTCCPHSDV